MEVMPHSLNLQLLTLQCSQSNKHFRKFRITCFLSLTMLFGQVSRKTYLSHCTESNTAFHDLNIQGGSNTHLELTSYIFLLWKRNIFLIEIAKLNPETLKMRNTQRISMREHLESLERSFFYRCKNHKTEYKKIRRGNSHILQWIP